MVERPAVMRAGLDAAQIAADLGLQHRIDRLAEIMAEQDIFGGMVQSASSSNTQCPSGRCAAANASGGALDGAVDGVERRCGGESVEHGCPYADPWANAKPAAASPERSAPSIVAGRPVSVQSPARNRLRHCVRAGGRLASCSGVAAKVARFSRTICQRGSGAVMPSAAQISAQNDPRQRLAVGVDQAVGGAHGHRKPVVKGEDPFGRGVDAGRASAASRRAARSRNAR